MRKGFTMIELIFVIVILGVLASVAIPRLAATRDDAEVAKAATNLTTAVSDITAYYTAKGKFSSNAKSNFDKITNALTKNGELHMKGTKCAKIELPTTTQNPAPNASDKVEITLKFEGTDQACKTLKGLSGIKQMCGKGTNESINGDCKIQIGGSGGITW
ncbi:putative type II secretion system protein [Candidatus Campylobacter infans]|uniref:Putative type II secretion system protein n=1 Tax=Candidatus Campylobacter infans TaxID=2561898 RepID=A0A7H9CMM7_9BACT|nr:type II secretion system protein [Candidatus Campylobacter infans]QLI05484.1 putative type II secretion system protein [Candidatus Campylobacter infans]